MSEWEKETAAFLEKIGQVAPKETTPKTTTKKDEEQSMAVFLNNKVGVKIGTVDLSSLVSSVSLNRTFDELEVTAMSDSGHRFVKGLEASSLSISFYNDTESNKTLQTLQGVWGTNATVKLVQDATSPVTISATNPLYTMTCLVNGITDINGATADLSTIDVQWNVSGTVAVATSGTW